MPRIIDNEYIKVNIAVCTDKAVSLPVFYCL